MAEFWDFDVEIASSSGDQPENMEGRRGTPGRTALSSQIILRLADRWGHRPALVDQCTLSGVTDRYSQLVLNPLAEECDDKLMTCNEDVRAGRYGTDLAAEWSVP